MRLRIDFDGLFANHIDGLVVGAQAEKRGMPQRAGFAPLGEPDFGDQLPRARLR